MLFSLHLSDECEQDWSWWIIAITRGKNITSNDKVKLISFNLSKTCFENKFTCFRVCLWVRIRQGQIDPRSRPNPGNVPGIERRTLDPCCLLPSQPVDKEKQTFSDMKSQKKYVYFNWNCPGYVINLSIFRTKL